jgi:hypothetical protein
VSLARALLAVGLLSLLHTTLLIAQDDSPRTTVGGYGEIHYTNETGPDTPGGVNVKRFVLYLGHAFSDRITSRGAPMVGSSRWSSSTSTIA